MTTVEAFVEEKRTNLVKWLKASIVPKFASRDDIPCNLWMGMLEMATPSQIIDGVRQYVTVEKGQDFIKKYHLEDQLTEDDIKKLRRYVQCFVEIASY